MIGDGLGNTVMTKPKTAILWGQDDLLPQAMEFFLTAGETWEVIRIAANQGIGSFVEQVQRSKPDLVILCQERFREDSDPLMKLFQDQPDLRVITVNLENNLLQVYSKHSITLRKVSDLLSIVEDRYFSEQPTEKEVIPGKTTD